MKEYIERNKAIEAIDDACGELNYSAVEEYNIRVGGISDGMGTAIEIIESLPAADVRPVVTCAECKWWTKQEASLQGRCELLQMYPTGAWFCANGKREEN